MSDAITVDYLCEFYEPEEIRGFWKTVGDALMSRAASVVAITGSTFEGGSATGVVLNTPAEMRNFMTACQAAIAQKNGDTTTNASALGAVTTFAYSPVKV